MRKPTLGLAVATGLLLAPSAPGQAADICNGYRPQAPRDIASAAGVNPRAFAAAPPSTAMNLCNIHFHAQAEHKGPGFAVASAVSGAYGGFRCAGSDALTPAELAAPAHRGEQACHGVAPGDTIEVHWVYTTCDATPGEGLGACLTDACANPQLRVESQAFLVVNDDAAARFGDFAYGGHVVDGRHQPRALPASSGAPVVFAGSTTGPSYTEAKCSPMQVTWSVRPQCLKIDLASMDAWCAGNVFQENHAHGVRGLVTTPALLSRIGE